MVLVGVFRHNLMQLLEGKPKLLSPAAARERYVRARSPRHILTRAALLRANYATLPPRSVSTRQAFLARVLGDGSYLSPETRQAAARQQQPQPNELPDSPFNEAMMDGLMEQAKKSLVMMVPQTVIMGWINFFFTGFVLSTWRTDAVRLPFPLTQRFKLMLQRDVDTADLSVSWVSSLSWYFLNLYGLDAIYRLVLGNAQAADSMRDVAAFGGAAAFMQPGQMPGQPTDYGKLHAAEKDSLALIGAVATDGIAWIGDGVEARVLHLYAAP